MTAGELTQKQVKKGYMARMMGASLGYLGAVFGAAFVIDSDGPVNAITIALAIVPGVFILLMMRALWRYIREVDEVARHDYTRAMMGGLFVTVALSGSWGLVELFHHNLPRVPIFWVFPVFFLTFGLISCLRFKRFA